MFDMAGNVIGINNAIYSPTGGSVGIGFAIPAEIAAPIVEKLKNGQAIERGYLGVRIQPINDDLAASLGLPKNRGEFIQSVEPGAGAAKAGIQAGDVVTRGGQGSHARTDAVVHRRQHRAGQDASRSTWSAMASR
jgi:serine protease Do